MAYYAAVTSLRLTIRRLLYSSQISFLPHSRDILESAYRKITSLSQVVEILESIYMISNRKDLEGQLREAVCKLEDALEFYVSSQFLSQFENYGNERFSLSLDLEELKQDIISFMKTTTRVIYSEQANYSLSEEDDDVPSRRDYGGNKTKMVGFLDQFSELKDMVNYGLDDLNIVSVVGMAGIGKTTLVRELYEDQEIKNCFECRAWIKIGTKFKLRDILLSLLAQMDYDIDEMETLEDQTLVDFVQKSLSGKRYLVVLDDMWNIEDWNELRNFFPHHQVQSRVILTTRDKEVADYSSKKFMLRKIHKMRFLNEEESWDLLREIVFGEEHVHINHQLEKVGKKIAEECEGLPLTIITVAKILSKEEKTLEYWNNVLKNKNLVFTKAYDEISEILYPSYKNLPECLKPCFLYLGAFPPRCEIRRSKLINLWIAEGFQEPNMSKISRTNLFRSLSAFCRECLEKLVSKTLVLALEDSTSYGTKTCRLHSSFWHLCNKIAVKEKFLQVINSTFVEGMESQRRLCIYNNVLLGFKETRALMESISTVHSLLCTGPNHKYPVPICSGLRLLRVLNALTIRFYKFPIEVVELVQLRYLALTCNSKIPASISKLWILEYFIVHQHLSINQSSKDQPYLPVEIWKMRTLKHLQVMGSNLPNPCGAILPNLEILLDVSPQSCTKEVLERIPNLRKLGIRLELMPDANEPLWSFAHLFLLRKLESLKCVVVNPNPRFQVVTSFTTFPSTLQKLSLSGFGFPWKYMKTIAQMPNLKVLKLRQFAFRGPMWVMHAGEFQDLRYLLIEDTDLVHWETDYSFYRAFGDVTIRHCYKLKKICSRIVPNKIEVVDCPLAVASTKQLNYRHGLQLRVHSSWEEGKPKS